MGPAGVAAEMNQAFQPLLLRAWRSPVTRFLMVGGFTFVLPLMVAALLREQFGLGDQIVFLLASILAIETNFLLSYFFTWRMSAERGAFAAAFLRFHASKVVTVALGQALFAGLNAILGFYAAYVGTVVLMTGVNFLLHRFWIFRDGQHARKA